MNASQQLRAVVVGCRMGRAHAHAIANRSEYELVAVCDLDRDTASACAERCGASEIYTDYGEMLAQVKPDVVAIATPTYLHTAHTLQAVEVGVKGICCEKPMAVCLGDARAMVEACRQAGVTLIINHQRRLSEELIRARQLVQEGALGEIRLIRGECSGDLLSDGTHLIDSIMWLSGDVGPEWVVGQIYRDLQETRRPGEKPGYRYGHAVESGAMAVIRLKSGLRVEIMCGGLRTDHTAYQDYQVFGSKGTLWRCGDLVAQNLFINDGSGGGWVGRVVERTYQPVPVAAGESGLWRAVALSEPKPNPMVEAYHLLAASIREGSSHPMHAENAIVGFELLMGIFESARLRTKIRFPLAQERYPLDMMIEP